MVNFGLSLPQTYVQRCYGCIFQRLHLIIFSRYVLNLAFNAIPGGEEWGFFARTFLITQEIIKISLQNFLTINKYMLGTFCEIFFFKFSQFVMTSLCNHVTIATIGCYDFFTPIMGGYLHTNF